MGDIELSVSLEEVNTILKALSKESFKDVFELIGKINEQAGSQIENANRIASESNHESET